MSSTSGRMILALLAVCAGISMVLIQAVWTTGEMRDVSPLPPAIVKAVIFVVGLFGLLMIYIGVRLFRDK